MVDVELECVRLAARQHGVVTRQQEQERGLTSRQLEHRVVCGAWVRVYPGVYRVEGSPGTWRQRLMAASLWASRGFALSHRTAAALHGFSDYIGELSVQLTSTRNLRGDPVTAHHVKHLHLRDVVSVECFRVTSMSRTLLDLAATEPADLARRALDEAMRRRWTNHDRLEQLISRNQGSPGVALIRERLHEYRGGDGPAESELEQRVLELIAGNGLPTPTKQRVVRTRGRVRRLDFHFPGTPVVIEADGYAAHATLDAFEDDRMRRNALTLRGFQVLHWTWRAIEDRPHVLVAELTALLNEQLRGPPARDR